MDLSNLSGAQLKIVRHAFLAGFDQSSLDMLLVGIEKPILQVLVGPDNFEAQVFKLLLRTKREGWTEALIEAAQRESQNAKVANLVSTLRLVDVEADVGRLRVSSLEKTVRERAGIENFVLWSDKLAQLRRKVCRIEDPDYPGNALGTGFLVSNDLVLTNYHVVEPHIDGTRQAKRLGCRFDYAIESGGETPGIVYGLANAWLVDHSRYSAVDPGDHGGLPAPSELDYALLRLDARVGEIVGPDKETKRGWIPIPKPQSAALPSDIIFIVQHPKGAPLKLAVGVVLRTNGNNTRLQYDANTDGGSSGSPCFDVKLDLVALHHAGDPEAGRLAKFNQGIPMDSIVKRLAEQRNVPRFWE